MTVTDENGRRYRARTSNEGRYKRIQIGDADRTVEGRVVYVIRYRVRDALGQFPDYDEIYWNATGNEWNTTIETATAVVRLPAPLPKERLEAAGYSGQFGSRAHDVTITFPEPGVGRFESNGSFDALEGMTVAVGWPHGLVRFPSVFERAGRVLADNWIVLLPFAWPFLCRRYRRLGRDPDAGAAGMVQYEPPPGLLAGRGGHAHRRTGGSGNWTTSLADNDDKIGPRDRVVVLDYDGTITTQLVVQASGLDASRPITIQGRGFATLAYTINENSKVFIVIEGLLYAGYLTLEDGSHIILEDVTGAIRTE